MTPPLTGTVPLGIPGRSVPSGSHVCAIYAGSAGRDEIVLPFLAEGLRSGHKCIAVLDSESPADVLAKLDRSADAGAAVQAGQLEVDDPAHAYNGPGRCRTENMLAYWEHEIDAARTSGTFGLVRAMGEMPSALDHPAGRREFFRFEARLNQLCAAFPHVILCLSDLERTAADVLMDTLRTHPVVIMDGVVHDNPYYLEPRAFLVSSTGGG
jgi:MEDS: MEthanogen/methylotroph, DcmR Sensory domain